jgi:NAD(P)-dependent dehydrogenase (short-subunit alcohol dehydrogenase family)
MHEGEMMTAVVTGATSGIGLEVARVLAGRGYRVIGIGRDPVRCRSAESELRSSTGNATISFLVADLASLAQIRGVAGSIREMSNQVDVLVNNAGTFTVSRRETVDGIESQLAVNWLAAFALTGLLLPALQGAPAARIVNVSSGSHFSGKIHWNDIGLRRGYHGLMAYDQSKLATVLFTRELARRLGSDSSVSAYAVDPGLVKTDIGLKGNNALVGLLWKARTRYGIPAAQAADAVAWCATNPSAKGKTGLYWKECQLCESSSRSLDQRDAARLWELGEALSGVSYPGFQSTPQKPEPHLPRSQPQPPV